MDATNAELKGVRNQKIIFILFQIDALYRPLVNSKSANQNWETSRPIRIEKNLQLKKTEQSNNFSKMVPNPNHQIQGGRPYRDTLQRYSNKEWYQIIQGSYFTRLILGHISHDSYRVIFHITHIGLYFTRLILGHISHDSYMVIFHMIHIGSYFTWLI